MPLRWRMKSEARWCADLGVTTLVTTFALNAVTMRRCGDDRMRLDSPGTRTDLAAASGMPTQQRNALAMTRVGPQTRFDGSLHARVAA